MANNDSIIGGIMAGIGAIGIFLELYFLIIDPIVNGTPFDSSIYWAMAIPLFLGVAGVLAIVLWIGITMVQTPPPEAWDFDDLEDDDLDDGEEGKEEAKPKKAKAKSEGKKGITGLDGVTSTNSKTLVDGGFDTIDKIAAAKVADLLALKGIGKVSAEKIINSAKSA